jgi:anti-anti-sigma factor
LEEIIMDIKVSQVQGRVPVTVLRVEGRINLGNAEELEAHARQAHANGARDMLVEMSQVPSITSAGLRSLLYAYKLVTGEAKSGGKSPHFKLLNPSPAVLKVLQTAGFDSYMDIHSELQEAVDSF